MKTTRKPLTRNPLVTYLSVLLIPLLSLQLIVAQAGNSKAPVDGVYRLQQEDGWINEVVVSDQYLTQTSYKLDPPEFGKTLGGPYRISGDKLIWDLDFNSAHDKDGIEERVIPFRAGPNQLVLEGNEPMDFDRLRETDQPLDGNWHFATRGPEKRQERRSLSQPRRTLKILQDGHFQWIAFNADTFEFFGSGGGSYRVNKDDYMEILRYFSRNPERVGARLDFEYDLRGQDWHHRGKNSDGEPLYEIWQRN